MAGRPQQCKPITVALYTIIHSPVFDTGQFITRLYRKLQTANGLATKTRK